MPRFALDMRGGPQDLLDALEGEKSCASRAYSLPACRHTRDNTGSHVLLCSQAADRAHLPGSCGG